MPSTKELEARILQLEAENRRLRTGFFEPSAPQTVIVPESFRTIFDSAQQTVHNYFQDVSADPAKGFITIGDQRYVMIRASALSIDFLATIEQLYADRSSREATAIGHGFLFDIAHTIGINDARNFHIKMGLDDPIAKLSAGPVHFAFTGWAQVEIKPESSPVPHDDFVLIYDHPYSFEAASWLQASRKPDRPTCIMSAGYSSGWCEESFGIQLTAVEISCRAQGDSSCTFVMAPPHRIAGRIKEFFGIDYVNQEAKAFQIPTFFERKRAEEALRHERDFSTNLVQCSPTFFVAIGQDGRVIMMNQAMLTALGHAKEEVEGADYVSTFIPERDRSMLTDVFDNLVHQSEPTFNENAILTKCGRELLVEWHGRPVFRRDGTFDFFFGVGIDITERREIEQEKARLEEQLQQVHKMEAIGNLAGGVAHDINNMLTAIMGSASMLLQETDLNSYMREDIEGILAACMNGHGLTRSLLGFARKGEHRHERISLNRTIQAVCKLVQRTFPKSVEIRIQTDPNLADIEGDPDQLNQVLVNLAINAADAMQGKGTLTFSARNVALKESDVSAAGLLPGRFVCVQVSDTGIGMDEATLNRAIEPFFTTKGVGEGTGLGLSMAYGTIKNHGGVLSLESQQGHSTTVKIFLPTIKTDHRGLPIVVAAEEAIHSGCGTILTVDDEPLIRKSGKRMLEHMGYSVLMAENGQQALSCYREHRDAIKLVLLDMIMPVMDGDETFHKLKEIDPEVRVILSSGYAKDKMASQLINFGVMGFIQKPYSLQDLSRELSRVLDGVEDE